MESMEKLRKDFPALKLLDKKLLNKKNGRTGIVAKQLHNAFKASITRSECATGSCPDLNMNRYEQPAEPRVVTATLTPQLPHKAHRPLCLSVSSDGRFQALEIPEWKNNLKAQMEQANSAGAASSTGSLERASLFCASGSTTASSSCLSSPGLSSPVETLAKSKSSSRFSLFSPPWNSSSESDSNPPSRSGSKKQRGHSRRGGAVAKGEEAVPEPRQSGVEYFHYAEPLISRVTDYIYVGNLNAAYSGRTLCRNNIDSIIDMSSLPDDTSLCLIPCTCSRRARHSWSRLKINIGDLSSGLNLSQLCFDDINECMDASVEKQKRVLVHCRDGYSLAPACVIQYLMLKQSMKLIAAYELLRAKYPVNIMECHQNILVSLERMLRPGCSVDPECFKQAISRKVAWN